MSKSLAKYKPPEPNEVLPDIDAHSYLQGVYRGLIKPNHTRIKAAIAALPFEKPKLAVIAKLRDGGGLGDRLIRAIEDAKRIQSARVIEHQQVIEAPKEAQVELVTSEDMSAPMARLDQGRRRRF